MAKKAHVFGAKAEPQKKHYIRGTDVEVERIIRMPGRTKGWRERGTDKWVPQEMVELR